MRYYLNIGSNIGDREANLRKAISMLSNNPGFRASAVVESKPWGFRSALNFLNVGVVLTEEKLAPMQMLTLVKGMEQEISEASHRTRDGHYADRVIDIDIVAIDELRIDTPLLTVPHRHLPERDFFLIPLAELAPDWRHPASGLTAAEMLAALNPESFSTTPCGSQFDR